MLELQHLDRMLNDRSRAVYGRSILGCSDAADSQIEIWGETPVQTELFVTQVLTMRCGAQIDKRESDRSFDLVGNLSPAKGTKSGVGSRLRRGGVFTRSRVIGRRCLERM